MSEQSIIPDCLIEFAIEKTGYTGRTIEECRLCLAGLILKAQSGSANGHTEEAFMRELKVLKKDRTPNLAGRQLLVEMFYRHSNERCKAFGLIEKYRK